MFPSQLLHFYSINKLARSTTHKSFWDAESDEECCYYQIKFKFDSKILLKECKSVDELYFNHRSQDKNNGYGHRGWQSLTLHGIDKHKTEHYTKYGFSNLDEANYHWTDVCELLPNLTNFLKSLPYEKFDRVRIMRLAPYGYIMPHSDNNHNRAFGPLNIAINNPEGCHFVFAGKGIVPFVAGSGMVLDVGREHAVINQSCEARYHIIVHGYFNKEFHKL